MSQIDEMSDYNNEYTSDDQSFQGDSPLCGLGSSSRFTSDSETKAQQIRKELDDLKEQRKEKWNEYMRNYRSKQKKEQTEAMINPKHIPMEYNGRKIYCRCDDVRDLLLRYTHVLIALYNLNIESFDEEITELLYANSNNLIQFSKILVRAFEHMINESSLTTASMI